jgi:hypothetical protein
LVVAQRAGLGVATLDRLASGRRIEAYQSTFELLAGFYDQTKLELGNSRLTQLLAERRGYAPAEAWPGDTIDDPEAKPDWSLVNSDAIGVVLCQPTDGLRVLVAPVAAHIRALRHQGAPVRSLAREANVTVGYIGSILYRASRNSAATMDANRAQALMTLSHKEDVPPRSWREVGFRRRVYALLYMRWRFEDIAAGTGLSASSLIRRCKGQHSVSMDDYAQVKSFYDAHWDKTGPGKKAHGFAPPMAWDDGTIDNPAAKPSL